MKSKKHLWSTVHALCERRRSKAMMRPIILFYDNELASTTPTGWLLKRKSSCDCRSTENLRTCCRGVLINCTSEVSLLSEQISSITTPYCTDESFYSNLSLACNLHSRHLLPPLKRSSRKELIRVLKFSIKISIGIIFIYTALERHVSYFTYSTVL